MAVYWVPLSRLCTSSSPLTSVWLTPTCNSSISPSLILRQFTRRMSWTCDGAGKKSGRANPFTENVFYNGVESSSEASQLWKNWCLSVSIFVTFAAITYFRTITRNKATRSDCLLDLIRAVGRLRLPIPREQPRIRAETSIRLMALSTRHWVVLDCPIPFVPSLRSIPIFRQILTTYDANKVISGCRFITSSKGSIFYVLDSFSWKPCRASSSKGTLPAVSSSSFRSYGPPSSIIHPV